MSSQSHFAIAAAVCCLFSSLAAAQVGELDSGFGTGGVQATDMSALDYAYGATVLSDGRIVVAGYSQGSSGNSRNAAMLHYLADGTLDTTRMFSRTEFGCGSVPEAFYALVEEADGRLLAGGYAQFDCAGPQRDFWIVRTEPDGTEVQRFDRPVFFGVIENLFDLLVQPDGKIVAVGFAGPSPSDTTTWDFALARYHPDGTLDETGFGTDGEAVVDVAGDYDFAYSAALQGDGKIVATGFAVVSGEFDFAVVRMNADGTPDATFGTGGVVTTDFFGLDDYGRDVVVQPDGKIVVAGTVRNAADTGHVATVVRYDPNGSLDSTFGSGGIATIDFGGVSAGLAAVSRQSDGRLVVAGNVVGPVGPPSRDMAIARLDPDGSLDPNFSGDGTNVFGVVPDQEDAPISMTIQDDGELVVVGYTLEVVGEGTTTDFAVARVQSDLVFGDGFESGDPSRWSESVN